MDAEARVARKIKAKDRKYSLRFKPKQTGRSVFTIQQVQAKRAEQIKNGRVTTTPSHSHVFVRAAATKRATPPVANLACVRQISAHEGDAVAGGVTRRRHG